MTRLLKKIRGLKKIESIPPQINDQKLSTSISTNEQILRGIFQNCADIIFRPIYKSGEPKILLVYIDGLTDTRALEDVLLNPFVFNGLPKGFGESHSMNTLIENYLIASTAVISVSKIHELVNSVLKANVGILIDGFETSLIADFKGNEQRSIEEPQTEASIRGPRDGFTESLRTNTSLLRRRIRSTRLKFDSFSIGELSQTDVLIAYIEDSFLLNFRRNFGIPILYLLIWQESLYCS